MTYSGSIMFILLIWTYCVLVCVPPFFGWGDYALGKKAQQPKSLEPLIDLFQFLEGLFVTCSYDYLSQDWNRKSFLLYAFIGNYCIPMAAIVYFYFQIVRAVIMHEAALKAQAKKMNVASLRANVSKKLLNILISVFVTTSAF